MNALRGNSENPSRYKELTRFSAHVPSLKCFRERWSELQEMCWRESETIPNAIQKFNSCLLQALKNVNNHSFLFSLTSPCMLRRQDKKWQNYILPKNLYIQDFQHYFVYKLFEERSKKVAEDGGVWLYQIKFSHSCCILLFKAPVATYFRYGGDSVVVIQKGNNSDLCSSDLKTNLPRIQPCFSLTLNACTSAAQGPKDMQELHRVVLFPFWKCLTRANYIVQHFCTVPWILFLFSLCCVTKGHCKGHITYRLEQLSPPHSDRK